MSILTSTNHLPRRSRADAPGWPEILAAGVTYGGSYLLVAVLLPLIEDDGVAGVVGLVLSGLMGLIAFAVAVLIRIRGLAAFGVRRAKARHLVVGASLGLVAYVLGTVVAVGWVMLSGEVQNVQSGYQAGAAAGALSLLATLIAGSLITPLGEEALFRAVIANALLSRYGVWVGVLVSAAIFAVAHGINPVLPVAFVVGILTALMFRWSGSIWPGVALHAVNNATALLMPVAIAGLFG